MLSCQHEKMIAAGRSFKIDGAEKRAGEGHFPVVVRQPHHLARSSASASVPWGKAGARLDGLPREKRHVPQELPPQGHAYAMFVRYILWCGAA